MAVLSFGASRRLQRLAKFAGDGYALGLARARDRLERLAPPSVPQQVEHSGGDDAVEEPFAVDVGRQHALRRLPQRPEQIIDLGILRPDRPLQVFFQRPSKCGRFAAGRDGDLNRSLLNDRRHDELAQVRDVDDVHRNLAPAAIARHPCVDARIVRRRDYDRSAVEVRLAVCFMTDRQRSVALPRRDLVSDLRTDDRHAAAVPHHRLRLARAHSSAAADQPVLNYVPKHDELKYTFGGVAPTHHVKPGTRIVTWTEDCYDGAVTKRDQLPTKMIPPGHDNPQTGPFFIDGAEPGDTIAIHITKLEPARDHGISSFFPGFGALNGTDRTAVLGADLPEKVWFYEVDRAKGVARTK